MASGGCRRSWGGCQSFFLLINNCTPGQVASSSSSLLLEEDRKHTSENRKRADFLLTRWSSTRGLPQNAAALDYEY